MHVAASIFVTFTAMPPLNMDWDTYIPSFVGYPGKSYQHILGYLFSCVFSKEWQQMFSHHCPVFSGSYLFIFTVAMVAAFVCLLL